MASVTTNNQPMPDFLGIPWGASQEDARKKMEAKEGVVFNPEQSGGTNLIFHGGLFANKDVKMWVLQFVEDQLQTAKILIAPPPAQTIAVFRDLSARLTREYAEPAQGGVIVNPPYGEGQELEAIAAGRGIAAALYAFGQGSAVEGSILCQVAPNGQIVTNYQNERLNRLAISKQTGLDAPVAGMPSMQPQTTGGGGCCFVATATLGDPQHPVLYALRRYRDDVLLPTPIGRAFVCCYCATAPIIAKMIEASPVLRTATYRGIVLPAFKRALRRLL